MWRECGVCELSKKVSFCGYLLKIEILWKKQRKLKIAEKTGKFV
jgi:hypothetical protein